MNRLLVNLCLGLAILATTFVPGCGGSNKDSVVILAAASTRDALAEITAAYTKDKGVVVKISADDSSKLAAQIVQGAPAHLFLSANETWADHVKKEGFAEKSHLLLGNTLVVVVPKGNPAGVKSAADLTSKKVAKVALAGPKVPAGIYARQALKKLDLLDELEKTKRIVSGDNVRVTLTFVERGEVEAGLVYATDAMITDKVEVAANIPTTAHEPIRYPLVLLKEAKKNASAAAVFDYLKSPQAQAVWKKHGFSVLDEGKSP